MCLRNEKVRKGCDRGRKGGGLDAQNLRRKTSPMIQIGPRGAGMSMPVNWRRRGGLVVRRRKEGRARLTELMQVPWTLRM